MKRLVIIGIAIASVCSSAWGYDGDIYLSFNPATYWGGSQCVAPGCRTTIYVFASLAGASANGIVGAEYKVAIGPNSNPDPGWVFTETFVPGTVVLGTGAFNPGDSWPRGVTLAWPTCQQGDGYVVLIETVEVANVSDSSGNEVRLTVVKRDSPSNESFQCPLFVLCDAPVYTKVCLGRVTSCPAPYPPYASCSTGSTSALNPPTDYCYHWPAPPADCTIAVQKDTWSRVKGLYRD